MVERKVFGWTFYGILGACLSKLSPETQESPRFTKFFGSGEAVWGSIHETFVFVKRINEKFFPAFLAGFWRWRRGWTGLRNSVS